MANNKVVFGQEVLIDLTQDTVTPYALEEGYTAHAPSGEKIVGVMKPNKPVEVETNAEMTAISTGATEKDLGKVYLFVGEDDGVFEKDALYILVKKGTGYGFQRYAIGGSGEAGEDLTEVLDEQSQLIAELKEKLANGGGSQECDCVIDVTELPTGGGTPVIGTWTNADMEAIEDPTTISPEVENIYFNIGLSIEEVVEILSKLTFIPIDGTNIVFAAYGVNLTAPGEVALGFMRLGTEYMIMSYTDEYVLFATAGLAAEFGIAAGWNPDFNGAYVVNGILVKPGEATGLGLPVDNQQEKYAGLMSLTSGFEPADVDETAIYRVTKKVNADVYYRYDAEDPAGYCNLKDLAALEGIVCNPVYYVVDAFPENPEVSNLLTLNPARCYIVNNIPYVYGDAGSGNAWLTVTALLGMMDVTTTDRGFTADITKETVTGIFVTYKDKVTLHYYKDGEWHGGGGGSGGIVDVEELPNVSDVDESVVYRIESDPEGELYMRYGDTVYSFRDFMAALAPNSTITYYTVDTLPADPKITINNVDIHMYILKSSGYAYSTQDGTTWEENATNGWVNSTLEMTAAGYYVLRVGGGANYGIPASDALVYHISDGEWRKMLPAKEADNLKEQIDALTASANFTDYAVLSGSADGGIRLTNVTDRNITCMKVQDNVTVIGREAFYNITTLTDVTLPDSLTRIENQAFTYCSGLTSIAIPANVTIIDPMAYGYCRSVTSITVDSGNTTYHANGNCLIQTAAKKLFVGCKTSVIPTDGSVTSIGSGSFRGILGMLDINIPNTVTSIGDSAFTYCKDLTSITFPNSVTSIGSDAFRTCSSLTSITIPNSVTSIGNFAFNGCSSLTSITIPDSVTSVGQGAFSYCDNLASAIISNNMTSIDAEVFSQCQALSSVTNIGNSVTSIGNRAFYYCRSLTSINIPNSVTSIGNSSFAGCDALTNLVIPDCVVSIGDNAFDGCAKLTSVTIPVGVTSINQGAFRACKGLTEITIPVGVTNIGNGAFNGCRGLIEITIPDGLVSIGDDAFRWCESLTSITIPDSVTTIGVEAFCGCSSLTSIGYKGTKAQWKAISFGTDWNVYMPDYTVTCTDGTIAKDGTET